MKPSKVIEYFLRMAILFVQPVTKLLLWMNNIIMTTINYILPSNFNLNGRYLFLLKPMFFYFPKSNLVDTK